MIISSRNKVLRSRVTGNDNLLILLIVDDARDPLVFDTTNRNGEKILSTIR
jgi:hypothetical protein